MFVTEKRDRVMAMDDTATCSFHGGSGSVCGPRLPTDEDLNKMVTRPRSVTYAKDWLGQLFLISGLVWKKVSPMDVITKGQSTTIFPCIRPFSAW